MAAWTSSLSAGLSERNLIEALLPRCYYFSNGHEGFRIVERLNTAMMIAARDLVGSSKRRAWLEKKIQMAIQYPVEGEDWQVLEKISKLRPSEHHFKTYLVWSLYLYLDGLSSNMTFLEACRKSGFLDERDFRSDEEKFTQALKLLGLWDKKDASGNLYIQNLIKDWIASGTFSVIGMFEADSSHVKVVEGGKTYISSGQFYDLVKFLCEPESPRMRTDNCISFAVAARAELAETASLEERGERALDIVKAVSKSFSAAMIYVERGDKIRFDWMLGAATQAFNEEEKVWLNEAELERSRTHFRRFLGNLPVATRKILYYTNQSIAHTEDGNLENVLPKGQITGLSDDEAKKSRESQGVYDARFKIIFAASGYHLTKTADIELHIQKKVMTTIHESWHIACGRDGANSYGKEFTDLKAEVKQFGIKIYAVCYNLLLKAPEILQQKSPLLNQKYLDLLNPESGFYSGYNNNAVVGKLMLPVQEEILANLLALSVSEPNCVLFKGDAPELNDLRQLTDELQQTYGKIAQRLEVMAIEVENGTGKT